MGHGSTSRIVSRGCASAKGPGTMVECVGRSAGMHERLGGLALPTGRAREHRKHAGCSICGLARAQRPDVAHHCDRRPCCCGRRQSTCVSACWASGVRQAAGGRYEAVFAL